MANIRVIHAAEVYTGEGPTGRFVEVTQGRVEDAGGNVLIEGHPTACVMQRSNVSKISSRLVPTQWREAPAGDEIVEAKYTWGPVVIA